MGVVEKVTTTVRHAHTRAILMCLGVLDFEVLSNRPGARDLMPEPFNLMDHVGNVNVSAQIGYVIGLVIGKREAKKANANGEVPSKLSLKTRMALGGAVVGLVLNGISESKLGIDLLQGGNGKAKLLDFIYGVVASAGGATLPIIERHSADDRLIEGEVVEGVPAVDERPELDMLPVSLPATQPLPQPPGPSGR